VIVPHSEHQWGPGQAQKLELPATWYWIKGCDCGAVLMEPIPKDTHVLFEQLAEMNQNNRLRSLIIP
jgi:hypothetical protein